MKSKILLTFLGVSFLLFFTQGVAALPTTVYFNDFESGISMPPWSDANVQGPNLGVTSNYHGNYDLGDSTTLTLTGLPGHTQLALEFDLYLFSTWDGNSTTYGPDYFSLSGDISFSETFTNHQPAGQSYPGGPDITYPNGSYPTHVYLGLDPTGSGDEFLISHASSTFTVTFGGPTSQSDEWWGIDNVRVSISSDSGPGPGPGPTPTPEPGTMLLLGAGLLALAGARRKFKR